MAVLEGGVSAALAGVGAESQSALHMQGKPIAVGALGHYRTSHRCGLVASQAANSRLFELSNTHATNIIVVTRIRMSLIQTAAETVAIENSIDVYRCTGFSAVDTVNTVTPVASKLRTTFAAAGANIRGVTVAGAAAGMTGGTLTKDTAALMHLPLWLLALVPTASPVPTNTYDWGSQTTHGESPLILVQNEGFIIENRVVLGAAAGASVYIDIEWAETTAY